MKDRITGNLGRWLTAGESQLRFKGGGGSTSGSREEGEGEMGEVPRGPAGDAVEPKDHWLCPVCHEIIDVPVITPCKHTFCQSCLNKALGQDPPLAHEGQPRPRRCPICRADPDTGDGIVEDLELKQELSSEFVECGNPGCHAGGIEAREWKRHQEECLFAEVPCWHHAIGCHTRWPRHAVAAHSRDCPYGRLRAFILTTNERIESLQQTVSSLEHTVRYQNALLLDLRSLHSHRLGDYFSFTWLVFCRPESFESTRDLWRHSFSVTWLQSLLLVLPILLSEASAPDIISRLANPLCAFSTNEEMPGGDWKRHLKVACGWSAYAPLVGSCLKGTWLGLLLAAVYVEGWSGTVWHRRWTQRLLMTAVMAAAPSIVGSAELLGGTLLVYVAAFALEALAGQHKLAALLWKEGVLATAAVSPQGGLKILVIAARLGCCREAMRVCSAWVVPSLRRLMRSLNRGPDLSPLRALLHRADLTLAELFQSSVGTLVVLLSWWLAGWDMLAWYLSVVMCFFAFFVGRLLAATILQTSLQSRGKYRAAVYGSQLIAALALAGLFTLFYHCIASLLGLPSSDLPSSPWLGVH